MGEEVIAVDRIRCDGHGVCADLLPEMIRLDDWGYPIVDRRPVPQALRAHARRAVRSCPVLALRLAPATPSWRATTPSRHPHGATPR